jgi:ribosomal protein S18 acetylase RimI-like enzyme
MTVTSLSCRQASSRRVSASGRPGRYCRPVAPTIRTASPADIPAVLALWQEARALPGRTDSADGLARLLARDPDALLVAEADGYLVGSVIAAFDGWRGSVYRLAVAPAQRRQGLARRLVAAAEQRLAALGAVRCQAVVVATDPQATAFWQASGWQQQAGRLRFTSG